MVDDLELDWRFARDCPRCGGDAAWIGRTEEHGGRDCLVLLCTYCGLDFIHDSGRWALEFARDGLPAFRPGPRAG